MNKKRGAIIFLVCIFGLFISGSFAFALETNYNNPLGFPAPTDLESAVNFWFQIIAFISGFIAIISFTIAGIQLAWGGVNPSLQKDAKDRMISSVLGLLLSVAAVLILRTINPALIDVVVTELDITDGVFYTNGSTYSLAPASDADVVLDRAKYSSIIYKCSSPRQALLLWKYPKKYFKGNNGDFDGVSVVRMECNTEQSLSSMESQKWIYEVPGVYFCDGGCSESGTVCSGYMSEPFVDSSRALLNPFYQNSFSIRVVNDVPQKIYYGIILTSANNNSGMGACNGPLLNQDTNKKVVCFSKSYVSVAPKTSIIFAWNNNGASGDSISGQGVDFYSEPYGWAQGARAGKKALDNSAIDKSWSGSAGSLTYDYTNIVRPSRYKQIYTNFAQKPGSFNIKGKYLTTLWSGPYCQTFVQSVYNMKTSEIYAQTGGVNQINIIPLK